MNRIILDHLKRWGWLWIVIGIANGFSTGAFLGEKHWDNIFTFQLILWLGAMQLNYDLQRGISRTLTTLPLTARQIGRSWWLVSVAFPALLLLATSALALMIHSSHTAKPFPLNYFITNVTANTLFLGTMFTLFVGELPGWPQDVLGWLRRIFSVGLLFAIMFSRLTYDSWLGIALLFIALGLTLFGWFRAEKMVVQRATFRLGIQSGKHPSGKHQAPAGFGGLPFLIQTHLLQIVRVVLVFAAVMILLQLIEGKAMSLSPERIFHATLPAMSSFGGFFIYITLMLPTLLQLRHLRTLPISTNALATLLILLPVVPVLMAGTVFNLATGNSFAGGYFLPFPIQCLAYAATMTIGVPLMIWRGMRSEMFAILILIMFLSTVGPIMFPWLKFSNLITTLVSLSVILIAFFTTQRLLKSSSRAYRLPPINMNGWGGWR